MPRLIPHKHIPGQIICLALAIITALLFMAEVRTQEPDPPVRARVRVRTSPRRQSQEKQIAARFAPIIHQGLGEQPRSDYITNFDFDGDWRGDNNWQNTDNKSYPLLAYVYYSVLETETHYFIHYASFHPRDYKGGLLQSTIVDTLLSEGLKRLGKDPTGGLANDVALSHENDLEGCLVVAEKRGPDYYDARVQFVETLAHNQFLKYRAAEVNNGTGDVVTLQDQHPLLFAEPKGHGMERFTGFREQQKSSVKGAMVYSFAGRAENPETARGMNVGYDLIPMYETLWQRALAGENATYGEVEDYQPFAVRVQDSPLRTEQVIGKLGAAFRGTVGFKNKARPPWGWFDQSEKDRPAGEWFFDPAGVIARHFNLSESFARAYLYHPYFRSGLP